MIDGIVGQRYDSSGGEVGGRFRVNSYTPESQREPDVACAPGGQFVVAWVSTYQDGYADGIFGQRFDSAGGAVGTEFQVNSYTNYNQVYPAVALSGTGEFVVVWASDFQDGFLYGLQRFDGAGARAGRSSGQLLHLRVKGIPTWRRKPAATSSSYGRGRRLRTRFAQRFSSAGTPAGTEFRVNAFWTTTRVPAVAAAGVEVRSRLAGFSRTFRYGIFARFDSAGDFVGSEFR
jgi:hypothetical protein